jgi:antitoxin CptB
MEKEKNDSTLKKQIELNRLIYQSWHRGCKETDILLGDFAKSEITKLSPEELHIYSELIEENDWDIYEWILNETSEIPAKYNEIIVKIRHFNT